MNNLDKAVLENPYDIKNHDQLILFLKQSSASDEVFNAYENKSKFFMLSPLEISTWLKYSEDRTQEFYESVLEDYPVASYWYSYLTSANDPSLISKALSNALTDFNDGNKVWKYALDQIKDKNTLLKLHIKRISSPHKQLEESFSELSSFISQNFDYDKEIGPANAVYVETKKQQRYIERYEIKLANEPSTENWISYLTNVAKFCTQDYRLLETLFARFLVLDIENLESVWVSYIQLAHNYKLDITPILLKFVRKFHNSSVAYSTVIRYLPLLEDGIDFFEMIEVRLQEGGHLVAWDFSAWASVSTAILTSRLLFIRNGFVEEIEKLYPLCEEYFNKCFGELETNYSVSKLVIGALLKLGDLEYASSLVERLVEVPKVDLWIFAYNFHTINCGDIPEFFASSLKVELDDPAKLASIWVGYERLNGSVESLNAALKHQERSLGDSPAKVLTSIPKKEVKINEPSQTRSRENYSVRVSNFVNPTIEAIQAFFEDCGTIRNIQIAHDIAILEFNNEQEVFTALTKSKKSVGGTTIKVERHLNSTVFVSNFPPRMSQDEVKNIFAEIGPISSIRFPQQKDSQKSRRFCYIEYSNAESAGYSIESLNNKVFNEAGRPYHLKVALSQPKPKEDRFVPISERKVRLTKLPVTWGESNIRNIFKNTEQVVIPKNEKRKPDHFNDGVAIVVLEKLEDLEHALALNGTQTNGYKIDVQRHGHSQQVSLPGQEFEEILTIGLKNVDDTLTPEQIKSFLKENGFEVKKVETFPLHKVALAEFESAAESGRANMELPSKILGTRLVEIVSKVDAVNILNGREVQQKRGKLMIPSSVQRKKKKTK